VPFILQCNSNNCILIYVQFSQDLAPYHGLTCTFHCCRTEHNTNR